MTRLDFDPATEVPDLSGKVILITGGTAGLGASAARTLAAHKPAHIVLSGRNQTAADKLIGSLSANHPLTEFSFLRCDLASLASVRDAAQEFLASAPSLETRTPRLDVLLCNAGIMDVPAALTRDGYETQFGTNHMGHALLIKLLLPTLRATAAATGEPSRCVLLASVAYGAHPVGGICFGGLRDPSGGCHSWDLVGMGGGVRYGQSKLANVLTAAELARRVPPTEVVFAALHPGVIYTGLVETLGFRKRMFVKATTVGQAISEEEGGWNSVWACTTDLASDEGQATNALKEKKKKLKNGEMYIPVGKHHKPLRRGSDKELAKKLWDWTENELKDWVL